MLELERYELFTGPAYRFEMERRDLFKVLGGGLLFVLFFDGLISCLRAYSLGELQEMTSRIAAKGYRWEIGEETGGLLPLRITYLIGCPQSVTAESAD